MLTSIFFDAGNTLVFADHARTLAPLTAAGFHATQEQLDDAERFAKPRLDAALLAGPGENSVDYDYWTIYYTRLFDALSAPAALIPECVAATRRSGHWNRVLPGTHEALDQLRKSGLRLAVISNSDGGIANLLESVGLAEYFETFTDSGNIGVGKPHPAILPHAARLLKLGPRDRLYVCGVS